MRVDTVLAILRNIFVLHKNLGEEMGILKTRSTAEWNMLPRQEHFLRSI